MSAEHTHPSPNIAAPTPQADPARRPRWRGWLLGCGAAALIALILVVGGGLFAVHRYGPQFGLYLTEPSPEREAQLIVQQLERGYYAEGPEWEQAKATLLTAGENADSLADLHAPAKAATEAAGGKHSFFRTPEEAAQNDAEASAEFIAPMVTSAPAPGATCDITTITIPEMGSTDQAQQQGYADTAIAGIEKAAPTTCGWIIDLRGNTGGNMYPMLSGLTPLLPRGEAMSFAPRGRGSTPLTVQGTGVAMGGGDPLISVKELPEITGQPIAILQDGMTASSGEAVLTSFRGLDHVETFGADSAGYSSANEVLSTYDGSRIVVTTSMYVDRDGVNLREQPIAPDHAVDPGQAEAAAQEWLAGQVG